ncbi:hypothetical protein BDW22DRAFT_1426189 [Trametopsis cervina]|nr:hypothetical protein BDW22DRAFT_1426189 [Trametopsis cervina]
MSTSSRSSSSSSSSVYSASTMSSSSSFNAQPSSIAALPSFAHSLSSLPTMTSVTNDMVHYSTHGRTKQASEAKLHIALQTAKQRNAGMPYPSLPSPLAESLDDDGSALIIPRRNAKTNDNSLKQQLNVSPPVPSNHSIQY